MEIGFWVVLALLLYMVVTYVIIILLSIVADGEKLEKIETLKSFALITFWAISIPCVIISWTNNALKSWIRDRRAIRKIKRARREGKIYDEM